MTPFERDMFKVLCGAGGEVIASREGQLSGFKEELSKCLNPHRNVLLRLEVRKLFIELSELKNMHQKRHLGCTENASF